MAIYRHDIITLKDFPPFLPCWIISTDTEHYLLMRPQCTAKACWYVILISLNGYWSVIFWDVGDFFCRDQHTVTLIEEMKEREKKCGRTSMALIYNPLYLASEQVAIAQSPLTTPMSFRSIEIDPCTKGLRLSGCVPTGSAHCLVLNFHHNTFWMHSTVIQLQMTFILHSTQSQPTLVFTMCTHSVSTHFMGKLLSNCFEIIMALLNMCVFVEPVIL